MDRKQQGRGISCGHASYLKGITERLKKEQQAGVPYLLKDLPTDHAAIQFAKKANPDFDRKAGK